MDNKTQKRILKNLINKGYKVEPITLTSGFGVKVDSNYEGLYPPKTSFDILNSIRKAYQKNYTVEPRGYYSAIFIY